MQDWIQSWPLDNNAMVCHGFCHIVRPLGGALTICFFSWRACALATLGTGYVGTLIEWRLWGESCLSCPSALLRFGNLL